MNNRQISDNQEQLENGKQENPGMKDDATPVNLQQTSSEDYFLEPVPKQKLMRFLFAKECTEKAPRFGLTRRQFSTSSMGAMAALSVMGQAALFSSKAEAMDGFSGPTEDAYMENAGFTRLDQSTAEDWAAIDAAVRGQQQGVVNTIFNMIEGYREVYIGFGVDQYTHMTQAATRAKRGGASDEMILAALVHDIGKIISNLAHADIVAGIVRPYVSDNAYYLLRHHMEFQWKHYGKQAFKPTNGRDRYVDQPWYEDAVKFSDEFDQTAFDPDYPTEPLEEFMPLIQQFFGTESPRQHTTHRICMA